MEESMIYDLLACGLLHKWKDRIEEEDRNTCFVTKEQEAYRELEKILKEQEKQLLKSYAIAIENKLDYICYNLKIKILNFGIKIAQELQKAFMEDEEQ